MEKSQEAYVKSDLTDGLCTIEFFHPAHNSLPGTILAKLANTITHQSNNPETRLILLKSGGDRSFCAGASFDELLAISDPEEGKEFFLGFARVINACRKSKKIIVGRVQGKAVGGGVGLASAVDYCMATKYASIKLSELALGIGPFVVGPAVQRKLGLSAFSQMTINAGEWQTAAWAKEKGLFQEVFDSTEQLDAYIDHFCQTLLAYNPEALTELKTNFWEGTDHWDRLLDERAAMSGRLVLSKYSREALDNIKSKA